MVFLKKNRRFLVLITCSMALLGLLEILWLRQVWKEQRDNMRQEADYLFQRTVGALQDSLAQRSLFKSRSNATAFTAVDTTLVVLPPPAAMRQLRMKQTTHSVFRSGDEFRSLPRPRDSLHMQQEVQVFVAVTDSLQTAPRQGLDFLLHLKNGPQPTKRGTFIRIERDTIEPDTLIAHYHRALQTAELPLNFNLLQMQEMPEAPVEEKGTFLTEPAFGGLLTPRFYAARFSDFQGYLLRKILPYAAFALLLFGITGAAFFAVFKSLREQQRLAALKNDFISNITHELKTPITTVGLALEALSDFDALKDPHRTQEYLAISKLELERLSLLVDKVLRHSMFEDQAPRLNLQVLDLAGVVRQVLAAMQLQTRHAGVEVAFAPPENETYFVLGDRLHLTSVVFNLLDNALKYGTLETGNWKLEIEGAEASIQESGGLLPVRIQIFLEKEENTVRLSVRDQGPGIAPEFREKIFEKFFRIPSGNTHNVKGHGLGLSYVANVVRSHQGSISVESEEGAGSTFIVVLPAN